MFTTLYSYQIPIGLDDCGSEVTLDITATERQGTVIEPMDGSSRCHLVQRPYKDTYVTVSSDSFFSRLSHDALKDVSLFVDPVVLDEIIALVSGPIVTMQPGTLAQREAISTLWTQRVRNERLDPLERPDFNEQCRLLEAVGLLRDSNVLGCSQEELLGIREKFLSDRKTLSRILAKIHEWIKIRLPSGTVESLNGFRRIVRTAQIEDPAIANVLERFIPAKEWSRIKAEVHGNLCDRVEKIQYRMIVAARAYKKANRGYRYGSRWIQTSVPEQAIERLPGLALQLQNSVPSATERPKELIQTIIDLAGIRITHCESHGVSEYNNPRVLVHLEAREGDPFETTFSGPRDTFTEDGKQPKLKTLIQCLALDASTYGEHPNIDDFFQNFGFDGEISKGMRAFEACKKTSEWLKQILDEDGYAALVYRDMEALERYRREHGDA